MHSPPPFSLSSARISTEVDAIALSRRELKFVFPRTDVPALRRMLETNARAVRFGPERATSVNSIYFDDDRLTACRENLAGVSRRAKIRLRWYDTAMGGGLLFFEVKSRNGVLVEKKRRE